MSTNRIIQVPASTANLGAGFDTLALALKLFLRVDIHESTSTMPEIFLRGEGAQELPPNEENLIWKVMRRVFECENRGLPRVRMHVFNEIPIARGLGSSAAAIVAGISCFEAISGGDLPQERFFRYALDFESHPDNLAAARYGGFTVTCMDESRRVTLSRSPVVPHVKLLIVVPELHLQTERARAVIPKNLSLRDAVFNIQRSSLTVAALLRDDFRLLREGLCDKLHQPFRSPLIPGFEEILHLHEAGLPGLLGICLSGAGPSVLVFAEAHLQEIFQRIEAIFDRHQIRSRSFELEVDNEGRRIA
jgi:homoserine kinase